MRTITKENVLIKIKLAGPNGIHHNELLTHFDAWHKQGRRDKLNTVLVKLGTAREIIVQGLILNELLRINARYFHSSYRG